MEVIRNAKPIFDCISGVSDKAFCFSDTEPTFEDGCNNSCFDCGIADCSDNG